MANTPASNQAILDQQANYGVAGEMPRYRSLKIVHALEIKAIAPAAASELRDAIKIWPADDGYGPIYLSSDTFTRWMPGPGDFIVLYADGYWSASPRKAFIEGHVADNTPARENAAKWGVNKSLPVLNASPGVDSFPAGLRHLPADLQPNPDAIPGPTSGEILELRRWAIEQAIDLAARSSLTDQNGKPMGIVQGAAEFERYVLDGKTADKPASGKPLPEEPSGLRRGVQAGHGADVQHRAGDARS